jgi:hypothetical protein
MKIKGISGKSDHDWLIFQADQHISPEVESQFVALFHSEPLRPRKIKVVGSLIHLEGLYADDSSLADLLERLLNEAEEMVRQAKENESNAEESAKAELSKTLKEISKKLNRPIL